VHFLDKETERFVRSRMERPAVDDQLLLKVAEPVSTYGDHSDREVPGES